MLKTVPFAATAEFRNRVNQIADPKVVKAMLSEFYAPLCSRAAA